MGLGAGCGCDCGTDCGCQAALEGCAPECDSEAAPESCYGEAFDLDKVLERAKDRVRRLDLIKMDGVVGDDVYRFLRRNRKYADGYVPEDVDDSCEEEGYEEGEGYGNRGRGQGRDAELGLSGTVRWVRKQSHHQSLCRPRHCV